MANSNLHTSNTDSYVDKALNGIYDNLLNCGEGGRNAELFKQAANAYEFVYGGYAPEHEITQSLESIADGLGLHKDEIKSSLKSARSKASKNPRVIPESTPHIDVAYLFQDIEKESDSESKQAYSMARLEKMGNNSASGHEYLSRKKLEQHHGAFFTGTDRNGQFVAHRLYNKDFEIVGYERIYSDKKMVSPGANHKGVYFGAFQAEKKHTCYITEGAADALSIMESTDCDCYSATSAGNISKVAEVMKDRYQTVVIALDNDNAGRKEAAKLKDKYKCVMPSTLNDYSDVFVSGGDMLAELQNEPNLQLVEPVITLDNFTMTMDQIDDRLQQMSDDVFILGGMAALQQITTFFAKPNTGKTLITLKLIVDDVKNGTIKGEKVYYVNADDGGSGAMRKAKMLGRHGIKAVTIGEQGFKTGMLLDALDGMSATEQAKGAVVIIDTYKKFANQMDKNQLAPFNSALREFTVAGGAVILLAHVNKNRNADGKLIAGGVSDAVDDTDAAYIVDLASDIEDTSNPLITKSRRTVIFENDKKRGDNIKTASYAYTDMQGQSYLDLVNSVESVDGTQAKLEQFESLKAEKEKTAKDKLRDKAADLAEFLTDNGGEMLKTEIYARHKEIGLTQRDPARILDLFENEYWKVRKADEGNGRIVKLINQ